MKLAPTLDRVAIRRDNKEKLSAGGIILGAKAEQKSNFGTVLAVGPGGWYQDGTRRAMSVKVGYKVLFTDYHTTETTSKVVIVDEEDILAVVK